MALDRRNLFAVFIAAMMVLSVVGAPLASADTDDESQTTGTIEIDTTAEDGAQLEYEIADSEDVEDGTLVYTGHDSESDEQRSYAGLEDTETVSLDIGGTEDVELTIDFSGGGSGTDDPTVTEVADPTDNVEATALSSDGTIGLLGSDDDSGYVLDLSDPANPVVTEVADPSDSVYATALSSDGTIGLLGSLDDSGYVLEMIGNAVDPAVTIDGQTASHSGSVAGDETVTKTLSGVSTGSQTGEVSLTDGALDLDLNWTETTVTRDPTVTISSDAGTQDISFNGDIPDGTSEDVSNEIDTSLIGGSVSLNTTVSEAYDGPPGRVGLYYSADYTMDVDSWVTLSDPANQTFTSPDRRTIEWGDNITEASFRSLDLDTERDEIEVETDGEAEFTIPDLDPNEQYVITRNGDRETHTPDANGDLTLSVNSTTFSVWNPDPPEIDEDSISPEDEEIVEVTEPQLSADVSSPVFDEGGEVNVTFYDGDDEQLGEDTLTENATASTTWTDGLEAGGNDWYIHAEDEFGQTTETDLIRLYTPDYLEIRNEVEPDQIVDENVTFRVRFFADQVDGDQVVERESDNGTIRMDGLPADEELVVTVREENANFTYRRIFIDSIIETQEIYVLPVTEPSSEIAFRLRDRTGRFDPVATRLAIEKPITRNETTEYHIMAGERFGADREFPVDLVEDERYRLRVINEDGEERVLGSYTVAGAEIATLEIGQVTLAGDVDGDAAMQASIREAPAEASHEYEARIIYVDDDRLTESLTIRIEDENGTLLRPETTESGPFGRYIETFPLDDFEDGDTAYVEVDADRDGEIVEHRRPIGDLPDLAADWDIDPVVLEAIAFMSLIGLMGLIVIVSGPLAALVGVAYAALLVALGILSIPAAAIGAAGSAAIMYQLGSGGGSLR